MRELNLLPSDIKEKRIIKLTLIKWSVSLLLITAILGLVAYIPQTKLSTLQSERIRLEATLESENHVKVENLSLVKETAALRDFVNKIDFIKANNSTTYPIIKKLVTHLPNEVSVTTVSYVERNINISGIATSYNSIYEMLANLQGTEEFSKSTVNTVTKVEDDNKWTFVLTISEVKGEKQ